MEDQIEFLSGDDFGAVVNVTRIADRGFQTEGGSTRHWLRDHFLPELDAAGFRIVKKEELSASE